MNVEFPNILHGREPLNANNVVFFEALKEAVAALCDLDHAGCLVRSIDIQRRRPVFLIDPPPAGSFIRGSRKTTFRTGSVRRSVMAAPFNGVQLEWTVVEHPHMSERTA